MTDKRDKLGRRIPQFDRVAAGKKASVTSKEKYGADVHKRNGIIGARLGTPGYFGKLKAEGKTAELKKLASEGAKASNQVQATKRNKSGKIQNPRVRRAETQASGKTRPQTEGKGPAGVSER